jgi:hypothetical protein
MFVMLDFASILAVKPVKFAATADGPEFRGQAAEVRVLINPDLRVEPLWGTSNNARMHALLPAPERAAAHD